MAGVLMTVAWVVAGAVGMVATQHRAAAAADLSALAGAAAWQDGRAACAAAASVARANDARLVSCQESDGVVQVAVAADSAPVLGHRLTSVRTARAGPGGVLPASS
jgi:secretion/DNA translocation related TadE-like protein